MHEHLKKSKSVSFPEAITVGPRVWGEEQLLVLASGLYTLKRISLKAGSEGGLQYHRLKNEAGVLISGEVIVRYDDGNGVLTERRIFPGDVFHFEPGVVHQTVAVVDSQYIEASTPHFNDRVHVEKLYGIKYESGGLPSTQLKDIEFR
jgi:quercetin dioxygenase-like cupin family protein